MRQPGPTSPRRAGRSYWAALAFLIGFVALLLVISYSYLLPALAVARDAAPAERRQLSAYSALLLAVVLFVLVAGLMLTFRIGRFFFPRKTSPRVRTQYTDAWAESGRRMEVPPKDE